MALECSVCGSKVKVVPVSHRLGIALCKKHYKQVQKVLAGVTSHSLSVAVTKCRESYIRQHGFRRLSIFKKIKRKKTWQD
jgi:recombinational DNA repair protein (RecF pathway)